MKITGGYNWGACSTLMLHSISAPYSDTQFVEHLLERLLYIGSEEHYKDQKDLYKKLRENSIPNISIIPPNYLGSDYFAHHYSWLICSTNDAQPSVQRLLTRLGFKNSPANHNDKNGSVVTLYFIHPKDAIRNCQDFLNKT